MRDDIGEALDFLICFTQAGSTHLDDALQIRVGQTQRTLRGPQRQFARRTATRVEAASRTTRGAAKVATRSHRLFAAEFAVRTGNTRASSASRRSTLSRMRSINSLPRPVRTRAKAPSVSPRRQVSTLSLAVVCFASTNGRRISMSRHASNRNPAVSGKHRLKRRSGTHRRHRAGREALFRKDMPGEPSATERPLGATVASIFFQEDPRPDCEFSLLIDELIRCIFTPG